MLWCAFSIQSTAVKGKIADEKDDNEMRNEAFDIFHSSDDRLKFNTRADLQ